MAREPITVALFRCNNCHAVYAVDIDLMQKMRKDGRRIRPPGDCACGAHSWTRIKEVV